VTQQAVSKKRSAKKKRSFNPLDLPESTIRAPEEEESQDVFWDRLQFNVKVLAATCVTLNSRATYSTAWEHWLTFCAHLQADTSLITPFPRWNAASSVHTYQVTMIVSFIAYLESKRPALRPGTVDNYISGLRHCLMQVNVDRSVFKAQIITQCRASLNIRQRIEYAKHEVEALPFLAEWFITLRRIKSCTNTRIFMVIVALQFAFVCLLRFSELCVTAEDHFIRACDVHFVVQHSSSPEGLWVLPEDAYSFPLSDLIGMSVKIRSAKNDQGGRGYRYYYERCSTLSRDATFDLVADMFTLACLTRPQGAAAFFSHNSYLLSEYMINKTIRDVVREVGEDSTRYSSHSMRIGGATLLAAAHFPDYIIQNMGRWKSLAFLHYLHWAPSMMSKALDALTDSSIFTLRDLRRMHAGA
jgi:hypothetical protein